MLINSPNISGSLKVTGNTTVTGSLTVLGGIIGALTGSVATASYVEYNNVANKPTLISGSSQVTYSGLTDIPSGIVSSSSQVTYSGLTGIPSGIVSGSGQISFNGITDKPTLVSGSSQITYSGLTGIPSGIVSGSSQITYSGLTGIPSGIVSGSTQIIEYGVFPTTGSNTFQGSQTVTGSLFITQNLVVAGSSSIQYISSSVVDIADNIITVNAFNPGVRFGGLAVADSGSSPRVSGSMLFDSIKDQWIFIHETPSALTSSVVLMGPETYNDLGNETYLSANRLPKGSGIEHLRDSNITDTGTLVTINSNTGITGSTNITGSVGITPGITVTGDGSNDMFKAVRSGNTRFVVKNGVNTVGINTDTINNPLTVNGGADFSGNVGIGITSPGARLDIAASTAGGSVGMFIENTAASTLNNSADIYFGTWGGSSIGGITNARISAVNVDAGNAATDLRFHTYNGSSSAERMRIISTGNIGIGIAAPVRLSGRILSINDTSVNLQSSIELLRNGASSGEIFVNSDNMVIGSFESTIPLAFRTQNIERMRVTSAGNVLIGTTSDSGARLRINGSGSDILLVEGTSTTTNTARFSSTGGSASRFINVISNVIENGNQIDIRTHGSTYTETLFGNSMTNAGAIIGQPASGAPFVIGNYNNGPFVFGTNNTERMRITSGGNIGIGTTSPSTQFNVGHENHGIGIAYMGGSSLPAIAGLFTDASSGQQGYGSLLIKSRSDYAGYSINFYTAGTANVIQERMRITSGGNVGIGTISPSELLDIRGANRDQTSGEFNQVIYSTTTQDLGRGGSIGFGGTTNGTSSITSFGAIKGLKENGDGGNTAGVLGFYTRPNGGAMTERMRITSAGNITTAGSITINSRTVFTTAALYDNASAGNNVGIGFGPNSVLPLTGDGSTSNGTKDLGSSSVRWATVFTSDLSLSNGIGDYTIVEGEHDLFLYNNKNNKVYKFLVEEVDPSTATPKKS